MAEDFEKICTASYWSKKYPTREEVLNHFIDFSKEKSEKVLQELKHEIDVAYGDREREKLDIFYPTTVNKSYLIIYIHGGYWQEGSKEFYTFLANSFVKDGYIFVNVGYDLAPDVKITEICNELQKSFAFLKRKFPELKQVLIGHSAGGHAALTLSLNKTLEEFIYGVILISGVFNLKPLMKTSFNEALQLTDEESLKLSFNEEFTPPKHICYALLVGGNESPYFLDMAQHLFGLMKNTESPITYKVVENEDHFSIIENIYFNDSSIYKIISKFMSNM